MIPLIYAKTLLKIYYIPCDTDQVSLTMEEFEPPKPELDRHVTQYVTINKYKLHQKDTPTALSPLNCLIKYPKANFDEYKPKPVLVKTVVDKNDEYYRQEMQRKKKEKISKLKLIQYFNQINSSTNQQIEKSSEKSNQMLIRLVQQKKPIQDYQTCDIDGSYLMKKEINPQNQILLNQVKGRVLPKTERRKFRQQEAENIHNLSQLTKSKYQITKTQYDSPSNIGQIILKKGVKLIDYNQSVRPTTQSKTDENQSDIYQLQQQQKNLTDFPQALIKLPLSTRSFHSVSPSPRSFRLIKNNIKV